MKIKKLTLSIILVVFYSSDKVNSTNTFCNYDTEGKKLLTRGALRRDPIPHPTTRSVTANAAAISWFSGLTTLGVNMNAMLPKYPLVKANTAMKKMYHHSDAKTTCQRAKKIRFKKVHSIQVTMRRICKSPEYSCYLAPRYNT